MKENTTLSPLAEKVVLQPVAPTDEKFLFKVYASTRAEQMAATGWLDVQQRVFLKSQFKLQRQGYQQQSPDAEDVIIFFEGQPVGRMMVDRTKENEIRGVDIAILPEFRSLGVGTFLIRNLLDEARDTNRPFRIQVEKFNHAGLRLYDRLGFRRIGESATHIALEWAAG